MKKLNIAFLSGGNLKHTIPYINFFKNRGHKVSWITYDRAEKKNNFPIHDISWGAQGNKAHTKWKYLLAGITIRKLLGEIKPDILHGHYVTSAGIICLMSGFRPFVLTAHGSDVVGSMKSFFWKTILQYVFSKALLINTVSDELAACVKKLKTPDKKILVATLGVDTKVFTYHDPQSLSSPVRLLCTRTLDTVYGPATIIQACQILDSHNISFTLTFAAGGPLTKAMQQLTAEKGLTKKIKFLGGYDNESLPTILHDHDIYLSASLWDGTSISLLEAMASGIFPIVSRTPSNMSWLREKENSLMFEFGNARELAENIKYAISNEQLRKRAVKTNRLTVEEKGDRTKNMLLLEEKYFELSEKNFERYGEKDC